MVWFTFLNKTKAKYTIDCITLIYFILYLMLHIALYHNRFKFLLEERSEIYLASELSQDISSIVMTVCENAGT